MKPAGDLPAFLARDVRVADEFLFEYHRLVPRVRLSLLALSDARCIGARLLMLVDLLLLLLQVMLEMRRLLLLLLVMIVACELIGRIPVKICKKEHIDHLGIKPVV